MKAFKFTLQPLRTLRQRREQEALEAYARALLERSRALARLDEAERRLSSAQAEWQREAQQGCCAATMARYAQHCEGLGRSRAHQQSVLSEAERVLNGSLKLMLLARQRREAVDKFLQKQQCVYDRALTREEQKFLDELAQRRDSSGAACVANSSSAL